MSVPDKADEAMVKMILGEINMDEKDLEEAVLAMKKWIFKRPHLPKAASDDGLLKSFIIACKSVERAKTKLDNYFTYRATYKNVFFTSRDPMDLDWTKLTEKVFMLPGLTPEGYKICLAIYPDEVGTSAYGHQETFKLFFMLMDLYCREYFMSSGFLIIVDMLNLSVELVAKSSLSISSASLKVITDAYPHRIKGICSFNAPPLAEAFVATFVKPFMSSKMKERIHVFAEDQTCLAKYFPLEMLPSDYGGQNPSSQTLWDDVRKTLESERDWFLNEGSQTVDESLRTDDNEGEMKGTFRKLQAE